MPVPQLLTSDFADGHTSAHSHPALSPSLLSSGLVKSSSPELEPRVREKEEDSLSCSTLSLWLPLFVEPEAQRVESAPVDLVQKVAVAFYETG